MGAIIFSYWLHYVMLFLHIGYTISTVADKINLLEWMSLSVAMYIFYRVDAKYFGHCLCPTHPQISDGLLLKEWWLFNIIGRDFVSIAS